MQSSTVIAASRDSAGDRDDSSGMEIDVQEDEAMNGNTSTSLSSKIDSLIREEEKRLPSWVMGKYKAYFNPYITSTGIDRHSELLSHLFTIQSSYFPTVIVVSVCTCMRAHICNIPYR